MLKWLRQFDWAPIFGSALALVLALGILGAVPANEHEPDAYQQPLNYMLGILPPEGWTALFTGTLVVATVALCYITYLLVHLGREQTSTTRAQLRAYISASPMKAGIESDLSTIVINVTIKNTGQTPAFEVQQRGGIAVVELPVMGHIRMLESPDDIGVPAPTFILNPGEERAAGPKHRLSIQEQILLRNKSFGLQVLGRVVFKDAFLRTQWVEYSVVMESHDFQDFVMRWNARAEKGKPIQANFKFTAGNNRASLDGEPIPTD